MSELQIVDFILFHVLFLFSIFFYLILDLELEFGVMCYNSKTIVLVSRKNLVLGNTRELNRELFTGLSTLYTKGS